MTAPDLELNDCARSQTAPTETHQHTSAAACWPVRLLLLAMIRTRFAPSPTGFLHIGSVRTAMFNWLFARKHGGQFILRIDDTDQQRNVAEALAPIIHGFRWLGLTWDEGAEIGGPHGPYYQSEKLPQYQAAVQVLLEKGAA